MVVLIPVITLLGLVYFVGGDIKDVKVFYHNDDLNCMLLLSSKQCFSLSCLPLATHVRNFIRDVSAADEFDLVTNGNQHYWYFIIS